LGGRTTFRAYGYVVDVYTERGLPAKRNERISGANIFGTNVGGARGFPARRKQPLPLSDHDKTTPKYAIVERRDEKKSKYVYDDVIYIYTHNLDINVYYIYICVCVCERVTITPHRREIPTRVITFSLYIRVRIFPPDTYIRVNSECVRVCIPEPEMQNVPFPSYLYYIVISRTRDTPGK